MPDGLDNRLALSEPSDNPGHHVAPVSRVTEVGAGQGGEGGGEGRGPPIRKRDSRRDAARQPAREPMGQSKTIAGFRMCLLTIRIKNPEWKCLKFA